MKMFSCLLFLAIIPIITCEGGENITYSQEEFKCSLPDVTSLDDNLDVTRFRSDFSKISEVKFPGLIGPLNERLICKIKCIDGNWVGPLCSSTPDGRFQPILRECLYRNEHPLLAVSFKNSSIDKDTRFPHGSVLTARCRHFGLYKLRGDGVLRCDNGEWAPRAPDCVPTTLVTNFTGDAPPSIQYSVAGGSAVVQPSGALYVFPDSSVRLDCVTPRALGDPDWSWTQALGHHTAGWSTDEGETETHYRLTLTKMSARHSDQYTCTAPGQHTNTVLIKVVSVTCPPIESTSANIRQFAQGNRLGHTVHFSCQPGYHLDGDPVLICMGDGRWSAPPPTCAETSCPPLRAPGPQLRALEYSAAAGGRAVFTCAWGYRLVGAPGLECEPDGTWSGDTPHCTPIYCPDPLIPENGRILTEPSSNGKYTVGDLMIYACDEALQLLGESSVVCTENGFWSHPPPFCLPPSEVRKTDTIYIENTTLIHVEE
ncbi:locomotion-related protein Hikaru genki isoform X2 [Ostrinia furnacalis]|uniref:locomotion-related protein Hikaru genki isoform X2 n=1 Tax=Ostrinia furnacalis TaxID=93504 RepID=UPI001038E60A|nr:locomotion-related protein Hikaru genki isoform X2 [Ostrinia furnacalis]